MTNDELFEVFKDKRGKASAPKLRWKWIDKNAPADVKQILLDAVDGDVDHCTPGEALYLVMHAMRRPVCPVCGKPVTFRNYYRGYHEFCSNECRWSSEGVAIFYEHAKQTFIQKYGVDSPLKDVSIREKVYATNYERYGCKMPGQNEECKRKQRKTNLKKYGCEYSTQNEHIKEKIRITNNERYGGNNAMASAEVREKLKKTCLARYGAENVYASEYGITKLKQTNLQRYGTEIYRKSNAFKEKMQQWNASLTDEQKQNMIEKRKQTCLKKYGYTTNLLLPEIRNYIKSEERAERLWAAMQKRGTIHMSKVEKEMFAYLKGIYGEDSVFMNYVDKERYPYHVDFFVKPIDLFIEIQGYFTHGKHPYDPESEFDANVLEWVKRKALNGFPQYNDYLEVWTVRDPKKRATAEQHHLNYLEIYTTKFTEAKDAFNKYVSAGNIYGCFVYDK